ncbi:hypothetical protein MMC25_007072 [Agyrium rufum]|nr:hypothetical protein [Agyrium rufum]
MLPIPAAAALYLHIPREERSPIDPQPLKGVDETLKQPPPRVGWIGLGTIGQAIARNIILRARLEYSLVIWNRTFEQSREFEASLPMGSVMIGSSISDTVFKSDIIFLCLEDDDAVTSTMEAAMQEDARGKIFVDCSSTSPDTTERITEMAKENGATMVACQLVGSELQARAGQLVCAIAGPKAEVDRIKPLCTNVIGRGIIDMGGRDPRNASLLKVVSSTITVAMVESIAEAHHLGDRTGVGTDDMQELIEGLWPGPVAEQLDMMRNVQADQGIGSQRSPDLLFGGWELDNMGGAAGPSDPQSRGTAITAEQREREGEVESAREEVEGVYGEMREEAGLASQAQAEGKGKRKRSD